MRLLSNICSVLILICLSATGIGQTNLVVNPSFESYSTCPSTWSQINFCNNWSTPTNHTGSADYDNACCATTTSGVPVNAYGSQNAYSGNAYLGLIFKGGGSIATYREYAVGSLSSALVAGSPYVVTMHVCHAQNSQNATDDCGIYFSNSAPAMGSAAYTTLGVTPQVANPTGNFLSTNSWVTITDTFVAAGGEQFLTIGSFAATPNSQSTGTTTGWAHTYMYIDSVSVTLLQSVYGDTIVCNGGNAELYSSLDTNIAWFNSIYPNDTLGTEDTLTAAISQTTTFWAIAGLDTHEITVYVVEMPTNFVGDDTTICEGDTASRLVNMPEYGWLWSDGETDSLFQTVDSGYHSLTIDSLGCTATDSFHVAYHYFPEVSIGNDTAMCFYDTIQLSPNLGSNYQYSWSTGSTAETINAFDSVLYSVTVSDINCAYSDEKVVTFHPALEVDLGFDAHFCYEPIVPIVSSTANATGFTWSTGQTSPSINISSSGTYTLTVTDGWCEEEASVHYDLYFQPQVDLGPDDKFCPNEDITLSANQPAGIDIFWNTSQISNEITVNQVGLYWVQVSDQYCSIRDSIVIDQHDLLVVNLGQDIQSCTGDEVILKPETSEPVSSYSWSDGSSGATLSTSGSNSYGITVSNGICTAVDQINVFEFKYPKIDLGPDTAICVYNELTLDVTSPIEITDFEWYDGAKESKRTFEEGTTGAIWVRATNVVCSTYDTINVSIRKSPSTYLGKDTSICEGKTLLLGSTVSNYAEYGWNTGDSTSSIEVDEAGVYGVMVHDGYCQSKDSIKVSFVQLPSPIELEAPDELCIGDYVELNAYHEKYSNYQWQDGSTKEYYLADSAGVYWVKAYHQCGIHMDTVSIERCECSVYVPSAFSPGNNQINDDFSPSIDCRVIDLTFTIFDRWGEIIFETNSTEKTWDGTHKGIQVASGTYGWKLELRSIENGKLKRIERSGSVAVLR